MRRFGFTMMELIIVIVVGGILAAVMIPRLERDPTREAANQIVRHIQYTQHLAMVDDVYETTTGEWYKKRWAIKFNEFGYSVASQAGTLVAIDPGSQSPIDLANAGSMADFGVSIKLSGGCSTLLAFDNLGKPHKSLSAVNDEVTSTCTIKVSGDKTAVITVQPQTGYAHLDSVGK